MCIRDRCVCVCVWYEVGLPKINFCPMLLVLENVLLYSTEVAIGLVVIGHYHHMVVPNSKDKNLDHDN